MPAAMVVPIARVVSIVAASVVAGARKPIIVRADIIGPCIHGAICVGIRIIRSRMHNDISVPIGGARNIHGTDPNSNHHSGVCLRRSRHRHRYRQSQDRQYRSFHHCCTLRSVHGNPPLQQKFRTGGRCNSDVTCVPVSGRPSELCQKLRHREWPGRSYRCPEQAPGIVIK